MSASSAFRAHPGLDNAAISHYDSLMDAVAASNQPARRWRRYAGGALLLVLVCALAFSGGFFAFAAHVAGLQAPAQTREADGIVVLTGGKQRIAAAIDLLKNGKGKRLLISGVNPVTDRAALQAANGAAPTLFSCCVDIDRAALDTIGNAEESAKWLSDHGYTSAIVVTSNYHIPRSILEMRRTIGDVELVPYPVVATAGNPFDWLDDREARRVLFTEYAKYLGALLRGVLHFDARVAEANIVR